MKLLSKLSRAQISALASTIVLILSLAVENHFENAEAASELTLSAQREVLSTLIQNRNLKADEVSKMSVSRAECTRLAGEISALARMSGLEIRSLKLESERKNKDILILPIKLTAGGSFAGVYHFFQAIEKQNEYLWFKDFRIDKEGAALSLSLSLEIPAVDAP